MQEQLQKQSPSGSLELFRYQVLEEVEADHAQRHATFVHELELQRQTCLQLHRELETIKMSVTEKVSFHLLCVWRGLVRGVGVLN